MAKHSIPLRYVFSLLLPSSSSRQIRNSVGEKHHEFSLTNSVQNSSLPNCLEKQFYGTTRTHVFYAINIVFIAYQLSGSFIKYFISVSAKIGHRLFLGCQSEEVSTNYPEKYCWRLRNLKGHLTFLGIIHRYEVLKYKRIMIF